VPGLFGNFSGATRLAALLLPLILAAGCSSPEDRARSYYEHGMQLLSEGNSTKAAIELRNAVRLKRDLVEGWRTLAAIDEGNGDWPRVIADMRTIVELAPNDVAAKLKLGQLLLLAGSSYEAMSLANAGLDLDNRNADLHALKAAVSLKLNDSVGADREAQAALELDPTNADALIVTAIDRMGKGDAKGALSLFQNPIVAQAKNLENNLGFQLLKIKLFGQTGDVRNAEAALRKLIELNPQEPGYQRLLINFYIEQRRIGDAEKELRGLAAANPSDPGAALDLVQFLYKIKKDPTAARQELNARVSAGGEIFPYQMALAEMDFAEGNVASGKQSLETLIGAGGSPERVRVARIALAQMYLSNRNFDPAEKLANDVLRDDPHNVAALKLRASLRLERAQLDAATADLLDALNYQPRSPELMSLLATAYERSGLIELADKQLADATRVSDLDAKIGLEYAAFLQRRGNIARAEDVLAGLNKRWPNSLPVLSALAQVRLARKNWSGAQEVAESIRRIDSSGGLADQIVGTALMGRNRYDEAISAFQSACNAAPDAVQPMDSLVGAFLKANRKDQAIAFLKSVLSRNPNNANALVLLGSTQLSSGLADQALKSFLAAVKAQPKDLIGYRALADLYVTQKNYDQAINVVRAGIQLQPDSIPLHMILASIFERKADYDSAISEYEFMLERQPGNLILANNLASLLLDHGTDKANSRRVQSLAAILRKSEIPQFKDTLGWASYHQGDYRTAVSLTEEASAALPDQAAVRYHLGMAYIATGQPAKASEQLKRALELGPDNALAKEIRAALEKTGS
jgi:tetratricopeptide (TPR) repeat protein